MYSNVTLNSWRKKIEKWADDRNIFHPTDGSSLLNQLLKFYEEFGELSRGLLKNNNELIEDSIGDSFVTLILARRFITRDDYSIQVMNWRIDELRNSSLKEMAEVIPSFVAKRDYNSAITILLMMSEKHTGKEFKAIETAYNEIKDRKGKMLNGVFVKEADLQM